MPTGKHHLGHGTNLWAGHLHLGNTGVRTKRVSVLIGKHHLLEQLRFNVWTIRMAIIEFLAVTILMTVENEEDISKGIHDDENNVCLLRATTFSPFLPLVFLLPCFDVSARYALDPGATEIRDRWNANQVNNHGRLFSIQRQLDNIDVCCRKWFGWRLERERLTNSLSLKGMSVTAYTFEAVRTEFVELFSTPKNSMENPSLRVSGHVSSMNRTFIVEDYTEDDPGQWAKDEVTGKQGYVHGERSCFLTWEDTECAWQSRPFKGLPGEKKKRKGKREAQRKIQKKRKSLPQRRTSTRFWNVVRRGFCLVDQRTQRQERIVKRQWWLSDGWVFALTSRIKAQARIIPRTKARESTKKEKARKTLILNPHFQPLKHLKKKETAMPANLMTGLQVSGLIVLGLQLLDGIARKPTLLGWRYTLNLVHHLTRVVLDLGCTRSIGSRSAIERFQKHSWYYGIATEICRCNTSFMFAKSETETCLESCIIHFPTTPPCSTIVDELETSDVPVVFSLHQMRNLGTTIKLDPQGDKIICAAFGLFSFVEENFIMGHIVWDLTSPKHQPTAKSSDRPGHPRRHVTFAMSERKPAYPAHAPDMHEDEDEDDKPLARPATRKEPLEEGRDQAIDDEDHAPLVPPRPSRPLQTAQRQKKKGPPIWQDPTATLEQEVWRDSRERAEETSILGKKAAGEVLRNIINKLSEERKMKDLHLKHYNMSTAQLKKRITHLDIPGRIYGWRHAHFAIQ